MSHNFLQLHTDKTEILVIGAKLLWQEICSHLAALSPESTAQVIAVDSNLIFLSYVINKNSPLLNPNKTKAESIIISHFN